MGLILRFYLGFKMNFRGEEKVINRFVFIR